MFHIHIFIVFFFISWLHTEKMNFDVNEQWAFDFIKSPDVALNKLSEIAAARLNNRHQTQSKVIRRRESFQLTKPFSLHYIGIVIAFFSPPVDMLNKSISSYTKLKYSKYKMPHSQWISQVLIKCNCPISRNGLHKKNKNNNWEENNQDGQQNISRADDTKR